MVELHWLLVLFPFINLHMLIQFTLHKMIKSITSLSNDHINSIPFLQMFPKGWFYHFRLNQIIQWGYLVTPPGTYPPPMFLICSICCFFCTYVSAYQGNQNQEAQSIDLSFRNFKKFSHECSVYILKDYVRYLYHFPWFMASPTFFQ